MLDILQNAAIVLTGIYALTYYKWFNSSLYFNSGRTLYFNKL